MQAVPFACVPCRHPSGGLMHKGTTHSAARGRAPHSGIVGKTGPAARVCFAGRSGEALNYTTGNYLSGMPHSSYHVPGLASEENFTPSPHACQLRVARVAATSQFKTLSVPPRRAPNQCGHNRAQEVQLQVAFGGIPDLGCFCTL
jgi:hypothetical protein